MNRLLRHTSRGFTLVELMVVIVIIGILAGIVALNVVGRDDDARVTKAKADAQMLHSAVEMWRTDNNGEWPESLEDLFEEGGRAYIQSRGVPPDPWGNDYIYDTDNIDNNEVRIICYGKDGEQGGEGYAKDVAYPSFRDEEEGGS